MKNKDDRFLLPFTVCLIGILNYVIAIKLLQCDGSDMAIHIELAKNFLKGNKNAVYRDKY